MAGGTRGKHWKRKPTRRDVDGWPLRADGSRWKVPFAGVYRAQRARGVKMEPDKGNRRGSPPGRARYRSISERLLAGFGKVLTAERAAVLARQDPFRAAELAVRIEQAPALKILQTPPEQYFLDFGPVPLEHQVGELVVLPAQASADLVERKP